MHTNSMHAEECALGKCLDRRVSRRLHGRASTPVNAETVHGSAEVLASDPRGLLGHMEVEGIGEGKDFKLYPGGGREWDWSETA